MNKRIFFIEAVLAFIIVLGFKIGIQKSPQKLIHSNRQEVYKNKFTISCSPNWNKLDADSISNTITPLPAWGNYRWNITTKHDSALFYFNQGINMYYAFHILEAMGSFKKAQTFDETNALLYWAEALAYGPNINDFEYAATPDALRAAQKAVDLSANCSTKEKSLINAMRVRYSEDSTISRSTLNSAYSNAMEQVHLQNERDADLGALYADALLLQHPWDYWKHNGNAQPWTPKILSILEKTLHISPDHPGANHYYIHAVEASKNAGRALASADRLGKLMPGVSHMVHMPSHIYIRTGRYKEGIKVNDKSVTGYNNYLGLYPVVANNNFLYLIHNLHMKAANAMMLPVYIASLKSANECKSSFDTSLLSAPQPIGNYMQYLYLAPQMVDVRYGKWSELLKYADLPVNYAYGYVLSCWSKGMAHANTNNIAEAKRLLQLMQQGMLNKELEVILIPFNAALDAAKVAEKILEGTISEKENKMTEAIAAYQLAVVLEDALIYTEPRDWLIPTRHYMANALIKMKKYPAAEKILKEDLTENPNNFYSLHALQQVLNRTGKQKEYKAVAKQFKNYYVESDLAFPALIY